MPFCLGCWGEVGVGFLCFRFRALLACLAVFFFVDFQFDQYFLLVFSEYPLICSDDLLVRHEGLLVCLDDRYICAVFHHFHADIRHFRMEVVCLGNEVDEKGHYQGRDQPFHDEDEGRVGFPPRGIVLCVHGETV